MTIRIQARCDLGHDLLLSIEEVQRSEVGGSFFCPEHGCCMDLICARFVENIPHRKRVRLPYKEEPIHRRQHSYNGFYKTEGKLSYTAFLRNLEKVLNGKLAEYHLDFQSLKGRSPEAFVARKRLRKLAKIIKLEHEFCGEEDWGI